MYPGATGTLHGSAALIHMPETAEIATPAR